MALRSVCPGHELADPKEDFRTSLRIEQYRFSNQAVYIAAFPGAKYIPFSAVRQAWIQDSLLPVTGTCGKALPITILRMRYQGKYYHTFTFEKRSNALKALDMIRSGAPDAVFEPEPVGQQRIEFLASLAAE